jgi:hypothetical protein
LQDEFPIDSAAATTWFSVRLDINRPTATSSEACNASAR